MTEPITYPSLSKAETAHAMRDKTYEYKLVGLRDWRRHKLAEKGWQDVDPAWPPANAAAAIGRIQRKISAQ